MQITVSKFWYLRAILFVVATAAAAAVVIVAIVYAIVLLVSLKTYVWNYISFQIRDGEAFQLECLSKTAPAPVFSWFKDGDRIGDQFEGITVEGKTIYFTDPKVKEKSHH